MKHKDDGYSDEFEGIMGKPIKDFLPSPENLVKKQKMQRITMEIPLDVVDFFKDQAKQHNGSYQSMIRELLLQYVKEYQHS